MNRRDLLRLLLLALGAPKRKIFLPPQKIFEPPAPVIFTPSVLETLDEYTLKYIAPRVSDLYFTRSPIFTRLMKS